MSIFLVNLSLRGTAHDYAALWNAMQNANAERIMDTTWLIDVTQDVLTVTNALLSHCASSDKLFVLEFVPNASWAATRMDDTTKAWLSDRMSVKDARDAKPARRQRRSRREPQPQMGRA